MPIVSVLDNTLQTQIFVGWIKVWFNIFCCVSLIDPNSYCMRIASEDDHAKKHEEHKFSLEISFCLFWYLHIKYMFDLA